MSGNGEEELPKLLLHRTVPNDTCHSSLVFCTVCFPCLVSSPPGRPLLLSLTFPAFQYFYKSPLNEKCILKTIVSFSHHTAKGNRKLHSVLTVNTYNIPKGAILGARHRITVPCYSKYIGRKWTVWLILCKTVKHKSHSRDFKSPASSWKKRPGFFLNFLESRL